MEVSGGTLVPRAGKRIRGSAATAGSHVEARLITGTLNQFCVVVLEGPSVLQRSEPEGQSPHTATASALLS